MDLKFQTSSGPFLEFHVNAPEFPHIPLECHCEIGAGSHICETSVPYHDGPTATGSRHLPPGTSRSRRVIMVLRHLSCMPSGATCHVPRLWYFLVRQPFGRGGAQGERPENAAARRRLRSTIRADGVRGLGSRDRGGGGGSPRLARSTPAASPTLARPPALARMTAVSHPAPATATALAGRTGDARARGGGLLRQELEGWVFRG